MQYRWNHKPNVPSVVRYCMCVLPRFSVRRRNEKWQIVVLWYKLLRCLSVCGIGPHFVNTWFLNYSPYCIQQIDLIFLIDYSLFFNSCVCCFFFHFVNFDKDRQTWVFWKRLKRKKKFEKMIFNTLWPNT